jgi:hypothetical protein
MGAIEFFNLNNVSIFKTHENDVFTGCCEIHLEKGERFVGIASHNSTAAYHHDIQFIIARMD